MWNLKYGTNEPIYRIETDSQTWKTVWRYLRKLYIELPHDPAISFLGIHPDKTFLEKDTCIRVLTATLFTIAKTRKQPKCP